MIADYWALNQNDRCTMKDLVRALGMKPTDVASRFAVEYVDGRCCLLLDEYQRDERGRLRLADGDVIATPHVLVVDRAALPGPLRPNHPGAPA